MDKWEKLNKEFDNKLNSMTKEDWENVEMNSMTSEDWDNWYENVEMKRINQNKMNKEPINGAIGRNGINDSGLNEIRLDLPEQVKEMEEQAKVMEEQAKVEFAFRAYSEMLSTGKSFVDIVNSMRTFKSE